MRNQNTSVQQGAGSERRDAAPRPDNQGEGLAPVIPFSRYTDFGRRWPVPSKGEILVAPIGGIGRIGMNWTLYGHDGRWLLVDAGIAFPGHEDGDDVDAIVPDPDALLPILGRLDGLVVTHGHEDHIGAIAKLWPTKINCPVWATPFAAALIERRLEEAGTAAAVDLRRFRPGDSFAVGPFGVRSVRMTHSIPEPVAFAISTRVGTVVHTGDWKIDPTPVIGLPPDYEALAELGDAGVLAVLADSTNAHRTGRSGSEASTAEAFRHLFTSRSGMVAVCCFSSNIARIAVVAQEAARAGRHAAIAGRSMRSNELTARELGLLDGFPEFLAEPGHLCGLSRNEMVLLCTGGQGDERAALNRLANGDWRLPRLESGDTVVLSGRTIPGNEGAVGRIVAKLKKRGVEVVAADALFDGAPVQVSGHPTRDDLETLYGLLRPKVAIPVHGGYTHQEAHAALARSCGAEKVPCLEEGEIVKLTAKATTVIGRVDVPQLNLVREEEERRSRRRG
jgi:ribonuclease J